MTSRINQTRLAVLRNALATGSLAAIVVLGTACGASGSKGPAAATPPGQDATSLTKFCSDDANEVNIEDQLGTNPDPSDPATRALLAKDTDALKREARDAPSAIKSDLKTLTSDTEAAAAGKTLPASNDGPYNDAVDAVNNWTDTNCSGETTTPPSGSRTGTATGDSAMPSSSGTGDLTTFCNDAGTLESEIFDVSSGLASDAETQQAAATAEKVANEAPADSKSDADGVAQDLQAQATNPDADAVTLTDVATVEGFGLDCDTGN